MRKRLIAGNWKMHGSQNQVHQLIAGIKNGVAQSSAFSEIDILVCPPFIYLPAVQKELADTTILWGAQNLYVGQQGAFTGEIAGSMLADVGCRYVLVGHSERRTIFGESLSIVAEKFKAAIAAGLIPILCVGESEAERERGDTEKVIHTQLQSVFDAAGINAFHQAVIAYEPVWAIGTGMTATPALAEEVHAYIRQLIAKNNVDIAKAIRILYGGSMKADNAASLLSMPNIDGGLIGGASLDANSFLTICAAACKEQSTINEMKVNQR